MDRLHYFAAGTVERGPRYARRPGYSAIDPRTLNACQPWETMREAQATAKRNGARAVFHRTEDEARGEQ